MNKRHKSNITKLNSINVMKFRGLENIDIPFGERITVICGKNGTSKSTILGIIAQAFSFRSDYSKEDPIIGELKKYRTIPGNEFESLFSEHFRLSSKYDKPGEMEVKFEIFDGSQNKILKDLTLKLYDVKDRPKARPVLRGNDSRNITHPVIFLSLERLLPITKREKYDDVMIDYLEENRTKVVNLSNQLLIKSANGNVCATKGTLDSMVVHGLDYDKESVSVGEDNTGQIIQALLSFEKLKKDYPDYHGGILLIDEADAGLFPAAQIEFIKLLTRMTKELNIQVILTSHSPTLIQKIYEYHERDKPNYEIVYLTNTFGSIRVINNPTWLDIEADLRAEIITIKENLKLPEINIYFEDKEAVDFYDAIVTNRKVKKVINQLKNVTLGCKHYVTLCDTKVPEFSKRSIIVLDGDQKIDPQKYKTMITLPGTIPPDQLLFEFLINLPVDDKFFVEHPQKFNRGVIDKIANPLRNRLNLEPFDGIIDIEEIISEIRSRGIESGSVREAFKDFYKDEEIQKTLEKVKTNPFRYWARLNSLEVNNFNQKLVEKIKEIQIKEFGVPQYQVEAYFL